MGKRGTKPQGKVKIKWSPNFAYAIGLLATDGCVVDDGLHIDFTSKDLEQINNFQKCLNLKVKIGRKSSMASSEKKYFRVQFGDVLFRQFLREIGINPAKSKTLEFVLVPKKYFFDFLRGAFDGDGHFYSYWDPRWKSSFMYYLVFNSASRAHIDWLREEIFRKLKVRGHITKTAIKICYQLKYAKTEALKIIKRLYSKKDSVYLSRKKLKIEKALGIVGQAI